MIKTGGGASWLIVNSRVVQLEGLMTSIDGNRDWGDSNSVQKSVFRSTLDISEAGNGCSDSIAVESAGVRSSCSVWIAGLGINSTVLDDVSEGRVHQTTIASHVSFWDGAVNEVLFRKADELVCLEEVRTFN